MVVHLLGVAEKAGDFMTPRVPVVICRGIIPLGQITTRRASS